MWKLQRAAHSPRVFSLFQTRPEFYLLDAELADGVIHQNHHVLHRHANVPIRPTALVRPVLGTLALKPQEWFSLNA